MQESRVFAPPRRYHLCLFGLSVLLVLLVTLASVDVPLTNSLISSSLPLKKQGFTVTLANWLRIPFPITTSFYLFNVTNAPQVISHSAKPILQEIGPFVFEERREKTDVVWSDDWSTVSYNQTRTFHFREDLSTPDTSLNESIYHVNVLVASAIEYARRLDNEFTNTAIDSLIKKTESHVFVRHTIDELLFTGYSDPLIDETRGLSEYPYDKFAWMYQRNGSSTDGRYTVATGVGALSNLGKVVAWNNGTSLDGYSGECSSFDSASAGDLFPPNSDMQTLRLFVGDTCRPIALSAATHNSSYPYMAFEGNAATYATDGTCFCTEDPCPPSGVANISSCVSGSPVYISFPHFLHGDSSLAQQFDGLQPDLHKHSLSLQVDDKLGIPTHVYVAMQLNVAIVKNSNFDFTEFQREPIVYYPCIYFISTAGLSRSMKMSLDFLHFALPVILIAVPALAALLCLMVIALVARKVCTFRSRDDPRTRLISTEE